MRRAGTALRPHSRPWPRRIAFSTSTRVALASVHRQTSFVAPAHKQQPSPPSGRPTPASSGPGHGATLDDARRVLRETFGFQDFRPEQEPVVSSILDGGDAVLGWPFKSGKTVSWLVRAAFLSLLSFMRSRILPLTSNKRLLCWPKVQVCNPCCRSSAWQHPPPAHPRICILFALAICSFEDVLRVK